VHWSNYGEKKTRRCDQDRAAHGYEPVERTPRLRFYKATGLGSNFVCHQFCELTPGVTNGKFLREIEAGSITEFLRHCFWRRRVQFKVELSLTGQRAGDMTSIVNAEDSDHPGVHGSMKWLPEIPAIWCHRSVPLGTAREAYFRGPRDGFRRLRQDYSGYSVVQVEKQDPR